MLGNLSESYYGGHVRCAIDWKKGKNITVKIVKKKQKHKGEWWCEGEGGVRGLWCEGGVQGGCGVRVRVVYKVGVVVCCVSGLGVVPLYQRWAWSDQNGAEDGTEQVFLQHILTT